MSANPPSPSGSMAGWSFIGWLKKNKGVVKGVAAAVLAVLANYAGLIKDPALNAAVSGAVGLLVKFGLDVLDYWLSESPQ